MFLLLKQMVVSHEVCRLVLPEHADGFLQFGEEKKKHKLQNHKDAAKMYVWMRKYGRVAKESSTLALRQGVFMGQD